MPEDLCTAPRIISLSPLSLANDVTDATLGASGLWLGTRTGAGGTVTLTKSFLWPQPMAPWTAGCLVARKHPDSGESTLLLQPPFAHHHKSELSLEDTHTLLP